MHNNFEELEAKCKKYYLKKMLKIAIPVGVVIVASVVTLISFVDNKLEVEPKKVIVKKKIPKVDDIDIFDEVEKLKVIKNKIIKKKLNKKRKDVKYNLHLYSYNLLNKKRAKTIRREVLMKEKSKRKIRPHVNNIPQRIRAKPEPKTHTNSFKMQFKNIGSIDKMIKVYQSENTYSSALKISKMYFEKRDYKQAVKWSKIANSLDSRKEEAWLIYAKSEYILGHKKRAKSILRIYTNSSNSRKARKLLMSWKKDRK